MVDYIYTKEFKKELNRRVKFLYSEEQIDNILNSYGLTSVKDFIDAYFQPEPEKLQPLINQVGPIDEWRDN